ncbi:hypothetical protein CHUAL_010058 [Chamberlinius hualienensis]
MTTSAKYVVSQPRRQETLSSPPQRKSQTKPYFIVIGLCMGCIVGTIGASMAYMAYFNQTDAKSMADAFNIPVKAMSLALLGLGFGLAGIAILVCLRSGLNAD